MGIDMFALTTTEKPASEVDFDTEQQSELHYWRKHPDLHGWMEKLYREKGGAAESFNWVRMVLGGQICLPGGIPLTLDATLPRSLGSGAWKYRDMAGYTSVGAGSSVVPVRFNCPPEITLHYLRSAE